MCGKRPLGMCRTVLLTGGIGSGKSAVSRYLESRGVRVYDSDSMTRSLYDRMPELVGRMEKALSGPGKRVILTAADGSFDRKALSQLIFSSPEALAKVEAIVHPAVLEDFRLWKQAGAGDWQGYAGQPPFVVMESAIALDKPLFEGCFDAVVMVDAPLQMRVERAAKRDSRPVEEVIARVKAQKTDLSKVDAVINNDLDLAAMQERTDIAFKLLYL